MIVHDLDFHRTVFTPDKALYLVVQEMTLAAALNDPRFARAEASELKYISIEVSVLSSLQPITSIEEIQLGKHGIYMSKGDKSGTLLPQEAISQGWSVEEFLGHCARDKAGIGWDGWKEADLFVYEAIIFSEKRLFAFKDNTRSILVAFNFSYFCLFIFCVFRYCLQ